MRSLVLTAFVLSIVMAGTANAQLPGRLKAKAKDAIKKAAGKDSKKADKDAAIGGDSARPAAKKDKDRKYPPGFSFSSVLNGVNLLPKNGQFRLNHLQTTFLPEGCEKGWVVLRTADGTELCQYDWKPDHLKKPYTLLNIMKTTDLQSGEVISTGVVDLSKPGDYVLDFYIPGELYYTFPFSVSKLGAEDPFGAGDCYRLEGDWSDWGYLFYTDAKPDQSLVWKVWLRSKTAEETDVKISLEITRDADSKLVCTGRGNMTHSLRPDWVRYEFDMIFPQELTSGGQYFKAKDLLETDGAYTLTMKIDDEVYGVWKFNVEGNKLQYAGRAVRGEADPLTFIEGGRDAWWYAKQKD